MHYNCYEHVELAPKHLLTLLQPFQGQLPQTDQQFHQLCTQLRRFGHISEQTPGNIATSLQGPFRQARPGAYHVHENQQGLREATQSTTSGAVSSFFGNTQDQASPGDPWASLILQDPTFGFDPFATWSNQSIQPQAQTANQGGSRTTEAAGPPVPFDMEEDSSTDSETSSDDGTAIIGGPDISQMSEAEAAESLFFQYRKHDRNGDIMKCRICGSEEHFQAECPQNRGSNQGGNSSSSQGPTFSMG